MRKKRGGGEENPRSYKGSKRFRIHINIQVYIPSFHPYFFEKLMFQNLMHLLNVNTLCILGYHKNYGLSLFQRNAAVTRSICKN